MNNKKTYALIIVFFIFVGIFVYWFFFTTPKTEDDSALGRVRRNFGSFFPISNQQTNNSTQNQNNLISPNQNNEDSVISRLRKISNSPIAGFITYQIEAPVVFATSSNGTTSTSTKNISEKNFRNSIKYIERGTGHIYETFSDTPDQRKISNKTIKEIYEAFFDDTGKNLVTRTLDEETKEIIKTSLLKVTDLGTTTTGIVTENPLVDGISFYKISPDGKNSVYGLPKTNFGIDIIVENLDGKNSRVIFNSLFNEWSAVWVNSDIVAIYSKPSFSSLSSLYYYNTKTLKTTPIINDVSGLVFSASPDGKKVLYSESRSDGFYNYIYDLDKKSSSRININTLADKCVWSKNKNTIVVCGIPLNQTKANYPDDWYNGTVSFKDRVWIIDTEKTEYDLVRSDYDDNTKSIDVVNPTLTKDENYLLFYNKNDMSLWSIDLRS